MLSGETCSPSASIGPPQPTPTATALDASSAVDEVGQRREQRVGVDGERRRRVDSRDEGAVVAHHAGRELGAADVDRNDVGHKGGG